MSHREEPREVGGIYDSEKYEVVEPKKRVALTPEQIEAGKTWVFHTGPESRYLIRGETPTTTVLQPPETYETWIPFMGPERPYVVGTHEPRVTDVTLIKTPPPVRRDIYRQLYEEKYVQPALKRRERLTTIKESLYGVQLRLYGIETGLRELSLIQEQRALGFELVEKKPTETGFEYTFAPKEEIGVAESLLGIHVPTLPEILGYSVPTPPELLGFGRMEPEHYNIMEPLAGFIAAFEQPIYTVGRMAGFETPRLPPGLVSGYSLKHPAYGVGVFTGQATQAYLIGKGIEKSPLGPPLAKAEMKVMSKIRGPIIGTKLDKFLLKHSKYWATLQEFKAGKVVFGAKPPKWTPRVYHGKPTTPMSVTLKKAISDTSGSVLLPKLFTAPKRLFTPAETTLPFSFFPGVLGVSTVLGGEKILQMETMPRPKLIKIEQMLELPKVKTLERQKPITFGFPITRITQRQELFTISTSLTESVESVIPMLKQEQKVAQAVSLKQVQKQTQQLLEIKTLELRLERKPKKKKRKKKGFLDIWFFKEHFPSPSQLLGLPVKQKRKRRK